MLAASETGNAPTLAPVHTLYGVLACRPRGCEICQVCARVLGAARFFAGSSSSRDHVTARHRCRLPTHCRQPLIGTWLRAHVAMSYTNDGRLCRGGSRCAPGMATVPIGDAGAPSSQNDVFLLARGPDECAPMRCRARHECCAKCAEGRVAHLKFSS